MKHEKDVGLFGAVIVVAIIGESKILLIKETTKPLPHYFKLISETMLSGEPILNALCRGVGEEAGLRNLETRMVDGQVVEIIDPRLKAVKMLVRSHRVERPKPHRRHFWGIVTTDEMIESLAGKHLTGDANEEIYTYSFKLSELSKMADLLPQHGDLIKQINEPAEA